jgi:hypothetical protein
LGWWLRHRLANQVKTRLRFLSLASSPISTRSAAVFDSSLAQCHGSRLLTLRLLFTDRSAVSFLISPTFRKVFTGLAWAPCPPRIERSLCLAFQRLCFGRLPFRNRQSRSTVLIHSSNRLPSGNCDSLRFETLLSYLTRFGTVSHRSSSLSPFFAFTDSARTPPEELVNSASAPEPCDPA